MLRSDTGVALFLHIFYVFVFVFFKFELLLFCFCELQPWSIDWIEKGRFVISSHFKSVFHQISPDFHNYFIPLQFRISIVELPSKAAAPPGPLFTLKVENCVFHDSPSTITKKSRNLHIPKAHYILRNKSSTFYLLNFFWKKG